MTFSPITAISTPAIVLIIIVAALAVATFILYRIGSKQQKKSEEAQEQLRQAAQPMTLLVIDKKRMKIKDSGLPKVVIENIPKRSRGSKVPIVKAKVGPRIMTLMCDEDAFALIPVRQEIRAMVSGIYILSVKSMRGPALKPDEKKTFGQKMREKLRPGKQ